MNRQELRTLRGQLVLLGGLFAVCAATAVAMASQREFFEQFLYERYTPVSADVSEASEAAATGRLDRQRFDRLSDAKRLALYEEWISRSEPLPAATPPNLVGLSGMLYIHRAERTIVCGNTEQRGKALKFLELSECPEAIPVLRKAGRWAQRRKMSALAAQIEKTISRLESTFDSNRPAAANRARRLFDPYPKRS